MLPAIGPESLGLQCGAGRVLGFFGDLQVLDDAHLVHHLEHGRAILFGRRLHLIHVLLRHVRQQVVDRLGFVERLAELRVELRRCVFLRQHWGHGGGRQEQHRQAGGGATNHGHPHILRKGGGVERAAEDAYRRVTRATAHHDTERRHFGGG